jgi:hypothetical protein
METASSLHGILCVGARVGMDRGEGQRRIIEERQAAGNRIPANSTEGAAGCADWASRER